MKPISKNNFKKWGRQDIIENTLAEIWSRKGAHYSRGKTDTDTYAKCHGKEHAGYACMVQRCSIAGAQDDEVEEKVSRSRRKEASQHPEFTLSLGRWIAAFTWGGGSGVYEASGHRRGIICFASQNDHAMQWNYKQQIELAMGGTPVIPTLRKERWKDSELKSIGLCSKF